MSNVDDIWSASRAEWWQHSRLSSLECMCKYLGWLLVARDGKDRDLCSSIATFELKIYFFNISIIMVCRLIFTEFQRETNPVTLIKHASFAWTLRFNLTCGAISCPLTSAARDHHIHCTWPSHPCKCDRVQNIQINWTIKFLMFINHTTCVEITEPMLIFISKLQFETYVQNIEEGKHNSQLAGLGNIWNMRRSFLELHQNALQDAAGRTAWPERRWRITET